MRVVIRRACFLSETRPGRWRLFRLRPRVWCGFHTPSRWWPSPN